MQTQLRTGKGQSLVEVALVLPILVVLFLGIAELGFFLFAHVQVANATRSGARDGSLCKMNNTCANLTTVVESAVYAETQALDMNGGNTGVNVQWAGSVPPMAGTPITVTVTYTHTPPFVSNFVPMFPADLPIQHRVVMRFDK
jgi:Flp pilus assembly protein TadG